MSQSDWRWCNKCQGLFFAGNNLGVCPAGGTHNDSGSGDYTLDFSSISGGGYQSEWSWCNKCQDLFFAGNNLGVCAAGGTHSDSGSADYVLLTSGAGQSNWRWCNKCQDLFFAGNNLGVCAAGGTHNDSGSADYVLDFLSISGGGAQPEWRWCNLCQGLFFAGNNLGVCPTGGTHNDSGSADYVVFTSSAGLAIQPQFNWRWCNKCQGLFFAGNNLGVCPAGGTHSDSGSFDYGLGYEPQAPTDLHEISLTPTNSGTAILEVGWTDNSNDEDSFAVRYYGTPGTPSGELDLPANSVNANLELEGGYTYNIVVLAVNSGGETGSNTITVTIPSSGPGGGGTATLTAPVMFNTEVAPDNYAVQIQGYNFGANEMVVIAINWTVSGEGSIPVQNQSANTNALGYFEAWFAGVVGTGLCPQGDPEPINVFNVTAEGQTSLKKASAPATSFQCPP
jgi:hypothetical protein